VRTILSDLFDPDLARKINYTGSGGKLGFKELSLQPTVVGMYCYCHTDYCSTMTINDRNFNEILRFYFVADAVRKNVVAVRATQSDIVTYIQNWFRNSRDLKGGRKKSSHHGFLPQQTKKNNPGSEQSIAGSS
jgi:hypothetical protein